MKTDDGIDFSGGQLRSLLAVTGMECRFFMI